MNKIYLDKLCEFIHTTHKNYDQFNLKEKDFNVEEQIQIIKQNFSLNEKGVNHKYNYIDLSNLIPNIEFDQLVLLHPIAYNIKENYEWNYLLNALLIVLNDDYLFNSNINKKKIIETFDKTFRKKIIIENDLNEQIMEKIAKLINTTLIILSDNNKSIYNNKKTNDKAVILYKIKKEYYPVINWSQKYFLMSDVFVKYIIDYKLEKDKIVSKDESESEDKPIKKKKSIKNKDIETPQKLIKVKSNITIDENKNTINTISSSNKSLNYEKDNNDSSSDYKKNNEFYEEVLTEANGALFISEAVDNKESIVSSTSKKNDDIKKTKSKKNSKDIFVVNNDKKNDLVKEEKLEEKVEEKNIKKNKKSKAEVIDDESVFKKTEILTKNEIDNIKNNIDKNIGLTELQNIATKLSINIAKVSEKTGKPKAKTKQELIDEIKEFIKIK